MGWSEKNNKEVLLLIAVWLVALALLYLVIIKLKLLFH